MAKTEVRGGQVKDQTIGRSDIDIATPGEAVVTKIVAGSGISISSFTGADSGTGDVTIAATGGGGGGGLSAAKVAARVALGI